MWHLFKLYLLFVQIHIPNTKSKFYILITPTIYYSLKYTKINIITIIKNILKTRIQQQKNNTSSILIINTQSTPVFQNKEYGSLFFRKYIWWRRIEVILWSLNFSYYEYMLSMCVCTFNPHNVEQSANNLITCVTHSPN